MSIYSEYEIYDKFIKLDQIIDSMCVPIHSTRPKSSQVLSEYNEWAIDSKYLAKELKHLNTIESNECQFFINYFRSKCGLIEDSDLD